MHVFSCRCHMKFKKYFCFLPQVCFIYISDSLGDSVSSMTLPCGLPTPLMIPTTPLVKKRTFHPLRPQSSGELPVRVVSSAPVARPLPVANIGKQPTNVLLSADVLLVFKPLISISGQSFYLPVQAEDKFQRSLLLAESFHYLLAESWFFGTCLFGSLS